MRVELKTVDDIIISRSAIKDMAKELGFGIVDQTKIATAVSELARNIVIYAGSGVLNVSAAMKNGRKGIEIICEDHGPGIEDIGLAFKDGYSTSNGLGMGLPGARRLMDELDLKSEKGKGTTIVIRKWL